MSGHRIQMTVFLDPEVHRAAKQRFLRYLDHVASNLRAGESILGQIPLPGSDEALVETASSKSQKDNPTTSAPAGPLIPRTEPNGDSKPAATAPHKPGGSAVNIKGQTGLFDSKTQQASHRSLLTPMQIVTGNGSPRGIGRWAGSIRRGRMRPAYRGASGP